MHQKSEWAQGMQRTDSYWRPSGGFYHPGAAPGRSWMSNGRYHPHAYSKHSNHFSNRQTEHRSYAARWNDYSSHKDHKSYQGTHHPLPMAPGHRRGKARGNRGGSRPFPSKRMENVRSSSSPSPSLTHSTSSGSPFNASNSRILSPSSSTSRSCPSLKVKFSRPEQERSRDHSFLHPKPQSVIKTKSDVLSTQSSCSFSASKPSNHQSSASSISPESVRGAHKSSTLAQSSSASVSSPDSHKMKFGKRSESLDITPVPLSTLDFCNSVPSLREILRRKPVVVLETLTEKLLRRKLEYAGLHFCGSYAQLVSHKKTKRKVLRERGSTGRMMRDDSPTKSSKADINFTDVEKARKDSNLDRGVDLSKSDINLSNTRPSLLVDPKVMSLSRPLQTAFSNNSSKTNMPFKTSGKGKNPSKMFSPKASGPVPRHMQMFDLDKLRTKLKGANFGGSRKPRQILNQQQDFDSVNTHSDVNVKTDSTQFAHPLPPNNAYGCTTSVADSTEEDLQSGASQHTCSKEVCENEHNLDRLSDNEVSKDLTFNVEVKENYEKLHLHEMDKCIKDSEIPSSVCNTSNINVAEDASELVLGSKEEEKSQSDGEFSSREEQDDVTYDSVSSPSVTSSPPHLEAIQEEDQGTVDGKKQEFLPEERIEEKASFKEVTAVSEPEDLDTLCKLDDVETDIDIQVSGVRDALEDKETLDSGDREKSEPSDKESKYPKTDGNETCFVSSVENAESLCCDSSDQPEEKYNQGNEANIENGKDGEVDNENANVNEHEGVCDGHPKHGVSGMKNPRTLKDICQDLLNERTDLMDSVSLTINDTISKSSVDDNASNDSNSKCLNDTNSKTVDSEDSSPMCIITSVESGAHIYFSESKSDLNVPLRRKPNDPQEEALGTDLHIKTEIKDNDDLPVNNSPRTDCQNVSVPVNNELSESSTDANTSVSTTEPGIYSPCITAQYSLLVAQAAPLCPASLENQAIHPVLVSSQENMQQYTSTRFSQLDYQIDANALPTGEDTMVAIVQENSAPLSLVPMSLPTVPSEYPTDNNSNDNKSQSAKDILSTLPEEFEHSHASAIDTDSVTISVSDAQNTESISGDKSESQDPNIVANVCQGIEYSTKLTKMVSDLDVMNYDDEEPPVLPKMSNLDTYDASLVQESNQNHNDSNSVTAENFSAGAAHCPELDESPHLDSQSANLGLLVACKVEYFEMEQGKMEDVCKLEATVDEAFIKTELDQERIEVGRLNLRRANGDGSEDSDATLIYSCDEDNTCFEEIFQDSLGHPWPRSAPWTETEDTERSSRYEGKLVIVSDIADDGDADGENTSDTNTSNERLSLIITTLRKDLGEKKSDRRQAEQKPVEEGDTNIDEEAVKAVKEKKKRGKTLRSKRKRKSVKVPCQDVVAIKQHPKKTRFKKRENLIVTLQRKKSRKDVTSAKSSKDVVRRQSVTDIDETRTDLKTKQKRKIKRRLTVKKRRKKVEKPAETSTPEKEDRALIATKPKKMANIRVQEKKLMSQIKGKKRKKQLRVKEDPTEEKTEDPANSDDSDELPTILPPKRRRLQSNGNPLMMMQNSIEKGSSSERIMLEFPRHNWLEQKINQLQQQTSCSPIPEDELPPRTSPKHASPVEADPPEDSCITLDKESSDAETADCVNDKDENQESPQAPAEDVPDSKQESSLPVPGKESFSLQEAMQLVGAEDSEGTLVIDESRFEEEENVSTDKNGDNGVPVDNDQSKDTNSVDWDNHPTGESDTTAKTGGIGSPLDLCVRKTDKSQGVNGRPKTHPPVQMVLPQVQQPARPVSTDPMLMKETKEVVQNVVVVSQEASTSPPASGDTSPEAVSEALNLSKVVDPAPQCPSTDFSDIIKGVVMPVVTQVDSSNAHSSDHSSTSPSTETSQPSSTGSAVLASTQSVVPPSPGMRPIDATEVSSPVQTEPPRHHDSEVMQPGQASEAPGLAQAPVPMPSVAVSQAHAHPRHGPVHRNVEGNTLDKEFEKHLKEFKQLEMLAARKEREREALLHLKKRKAMLLKEMKFMKTQQSSDSDNRGNRQLHAQNEAQFGSIQGLRHHAERPNFPNTQQVAELRPFQPGAQTMAGNLHQTKHSMYTSSPMSQTQTSTSYDGSSHRKRPSDDRRPLVQMINLAMLQRGRKLRRLNDDQRAGIGGNSSGSVPTPAHQNKSDININPDADVPSSEITHSPYVKRKTPILEPPGSNRSIPSSAALVPAHSQQPFQTAGSLIVPARNGQEQNPPSTYSTGNPHHRTNMVSPSAQSQTYLRPNSTQGPHKNNLTDVHNESIPRNSTDSNFNAHHVSQDQTMPYVGNSADRSVVNPNSNPNMFPNTNPNPNLHQPDHFGNVPSQWSPNMQNQFSNNPRLPSQVTHPSMQPMRSPAPHAMNQYVQPSQPYGLRPDRNMEVIDLTKEQDQSKMMHRMPGLETGGTETSVQRELTAALARRQGLEQQQQQQQQQPLPQRRKPEASNPTSYSTNAYGNPVSSHSVQNRPQQNAMYSHQGLAQQGNMMPPASTNPQFQMPQRPGAVGSQYRMQEPTSVKSALLAHGTKMICPPSYPMNTSAPASSYSSAQYQQQRNMKVPQQMSGSSHSVEGYSPAADKNPMVPGMTHMQQIPPSYNEHLHAARATGQFKPQQNWRPQVPTSVSNVQMSFEKQQQLMMMTRKTQWEQFQQQKHAMAQKGLAVASGNQLHDMHTAVSSMPQVGGSMYALAQATGPVVADSASMQQRAAMHQHSIRMMQRAPAPGPAQMQGKLQPPPAYPRDSAMMVPGQSAAPALIEFQQQEGQRRMQPMTVNQPPPRLHQFNGSCVVCGALAMYLCSSCRMVWYCSQSCQNNHWKRHGAECKPVQKPGMPGPI